MLQGSHLSHQLCAFVQSCLTDSWIKQPVLRRPKVRDTGIFLWLWKDHVREVMWDWERHAGKQNEGQKSSGDDNLPPPPPLCLSLISLSLVNLTAECSTLLQGDTAALFSFLSPEFFIICSSENQHFTHIFFLTAEDPVSASGPIRNVRSIVDLIFTGDGSAFSVRGSDHYRPIGITIKELPPKLMIQ